MDDFNPIDVVIERAQKIISSDLHIPEEFADERSVKIDQGNGEGKK